MMMCERCEGLGVVQVDGHEVRCTCVRDLAQHEAAISRLERLLELVAEERRVHRLAAEKERRAKLRLSSWAWLDGLDIDREETARSPCGGWWAKPTIYADGVTLEIWCTPPDRDEEMVGWVGTLERLDHGWVLVNATRIQAMATLEGHLEAGPDISVEPTPLPAEAVCRALVVVEELMSVPRGEPGRRLIVDGVRWAPGWAGRWAVGELAYVEWRHDAWQWRAGSCVEQKALDDGLLALWRATYALRRAVRAVGL